MTCNHYLSAIMIGMGVTSAIAAKESIRPILDSYDHRQEYTQAQRDAMYLANWQREISDSDFFGVFADGAWTKKPMLDYASKAKLAAVEAAAKAGAIETDADCAYVQTGQDGKVKWAIRKGGSGITMDGETIPHEAMKPLAPPALPVRE